jgi:hypothetical protein
VMTALPRFVASRYVEPLREGGSLPAVVETDGGMFVVKFRGSGQGAKALVAELIVGMIARELGLPLPELALIDVPEQFGRSEPDPEIQDLLRASHGTNVGLRYLDGAFNFALAAAGDLISTRIATRTVWLDAFLTNPDRTHRNTNLLIWQRQPWLIDHGAALYAHHDWPRVNETRTRAPFPLIRDHVLLSRADDLHQTDSTLAGLLSAERLAHVLDGVPDELLLEGGEFSTPAAARARYQRYLEDRVREPRAFVDGAIEAREKLLRETPLPLSSRR